MDELRFLIVDECYFISSYQNILQNLNCDEPEFRKSLTELLNDQLIDQLLFNEATKDHDRLSAPDVNSFENSFFVATKKGLLWHNSRG